MVASGDFWGQRGGAEEEVFSVSQSVTADFRSGCLQCRCSGNIKKKNFSRKITID